MSFRMSMFAQIAREHANQIGKNIIGQLVQNDGGQFSLKGEVRTAVNWANTLKSLKSKKGMAKITWPKLFEILGKSEIETPLSQTFVAYRLRQLFAVLSQADIVFCLASEVAWQDDNGNFSPKLFDTWIKDNKFLVQYTNRQGEVVSEFAPDGQTMGFLIESAKSFAKISGYHSAKSAHDAELLPADVLTDFQV